MLRRSWIAAVAFCAAMAIPGLAAAQTVAYAAGDGYTNLREGPSSRYRVIARLYPGTRVDVLGCLDTRAWCDVVAQGIRGWVFSRRLEFLYSGRRYLVPDYYNYFDAPYVVFRFGDHPRPRRHRDWDSSAGGGNDKPIFGHPGGGGPGPEYTAPVEGTVGIPPEDTVGDKPLFGQPGGGPGPEQIVPMEGTEGGGPCQPGDPNCLEGTQ